VVMHAFAEIVVPELGVLDDLESRANFVKSLALDQHHQFRGILEDVLDLPSGRAVYDLILKRVEIASAAPPGLKGDQANPNEWVRHRFQEVLLAYVWPRLDAAVTSGMAHLCKSPMVAHPKSKRIAVPVRRDNLMHFKPAEAPSILSDIDTALVKRMGLFMARVGRPPPAPKSLTLDVEDAAGPPAPRRGKKQRRRSPLVPKGA